MICVAESVDGMLEVLGKGVLLERVYEDLECVCLRLGLSRKDFSTDYPSLVMLVLRVTDEYLAESDHALA